MWRVSIWRLGALECRHPYSVRAADVLSVRTATPGGAMPSSDDYRRRSQECTHLSEATNDEAERDALQRIARQWEWLASYKMRLEAGQGPLAISGAARTTPRMRVVPWATPAAWPARR